MKAVFDFSFFVTEKAPPREWHSSRVFCQHQEDNDGNFSYD